MEDSHQQNDQQPSAIVEEVKNVQSESAQRLVKIKQIDGSVIEIRVDPDITVAEFRKVIHTHSQVPPESQRLIYKAKLLVDEQPLSTYIKEDGETIHMVKKPPGAPASTGNAGGQSAGQANIPVGNASQPQQQNQQQNPQANPFQGLLDNLLGNVGNIFGLPPQQVNQQQIPGGNHIEVIFGQGQPQAHVHAHAHPHPHMHQHPHSQPAQGFPFQANPQQQQPQASGQPNTNPRMGPPPMMGGFPFPFPFAGFGQPGAQAQPRQASPAPAQQQARSSQLGSAAQTHSQSQEAQPRPAAGAGPQVIQLPHQNVFMIGNLCNSMMGEQAHFPGPIMPQLPMERNMCVMLGSYLCNYALNLQRLIPFMQRCGDLLQRESLLAQARDRHSTEELTHNIGRALEQVALASASVAHFYNQIQLRDVPGQFNVVTENYRRDFEPILLQTGTIQRPGGHQQPPQIHSTQVIIQQNGAHPQNPQQVQNNINVNFLEQVRNWQQRVAEHQQQQQPQQQQTQAASSTTDNSNQQSTETQNIQNQAQAATTQANIPASAGPSLQAQQPAQADSIQNLISMANPLISNILGNANFNQSLGEIANLDIDAAADEEDLTIFNLILSQLSLQEILALMQGNFAVIQGLSRKLKNVLLKRIPQKKDTPENRKLMAARESEKYKAYLIIPEDVRENIYEGFDPIIASADIIDAHFEKIINAILDFDDVNKLDTEFIEMIQDILAYFIGELTEELQDGFHNGLSDVILFYRANVRVQLEVAGGPEMGGMMSSMGLEKAMTLITTAHQRYLQNKENRRQAQTASSEQNRPAAEDVKMAEPEESKESGVPAQVIEETPEQKRERFLAKYSSVIERDVQRMAKQGQNREQRPLGRAYLSLDPFNKSNNVQVEEEKKSVDATYLVERTSKHKTPSEYLRQAIRRNVIEFGYPTQKVDEVFQDVNELPESLVKAFYEMTRSDIKDRLSSDDDFQDVLAKATEGSDNGFLGNLRQL